MSDVFPTFVINLDRSIDRLAHFVDQAEAIGLMFERVCAIEGYNVPDDLRDQFFQDDGTVLTHGEVGCYASHMLVWQEIIRRDLAYALVLEDDAILAPDLILSIVEALRAAPNDRDIIKVCNTSKRGVVRVRRMGPRNLVHFVRQPVLTTGHLISNEGASRMLDARNSPRVFSIDVDMRMPWVRDLEVYGVVPPPVTEPHKKEKSIIMKMGGRSSLEHGLPSNTLKRLDLTCARARVGLLKALLCLALPLPLKILPKRWRPSLVL